MSPLRFAYFNAGEIFTVCILGVFLFFIFFSFSEADSILEKEDFSNVAIKEIYRLEMDAFERNGQYVNLEELIARSNVLDDFKTYPKQMKDYDSQELASDGDYFYLLKLEREKSKSAVLIEDEKERKAVGFQCICWPRHFGTTGEICHYVNDSGLLSVSANTFGILDGVKKYSSFPPDMKEAARAVPRSKSKKGAQWFRLKGFAESDPLPTPFD